MADPGNKLSTVLQFVGWAKKDPDGRVRPPLVLTNPNKDEEPTGMYSGLKIYGSALFTKDQVLDILSNVAKPDDEKAWPMFSLAIED